MDTLENPGLRGRAFVDALARLGDALESLADALGSLGEAFGSLGNALESLGDASGGRLDVLKLVGRANMRQLGANFGPTSGQLGGNMSQHEPTWAKLGPTWR